MRIVSFQEATAGDRGVVFEEAFSRLRVTLHPGGIWRLLLTTRVEDADKKSWVARELDSLPIQIDAQPAAWTLSGAGAEPLVIRRGTSGFTWNGVAAASVGLARTRALTNLAHMRTLAIGTGEPVAETVDGLPYGAGVEVVLDETPARRWFGLGERTGFLDKKGRLWSNWATDMSRHSPWSDPLYQAHPFLLGGEEGRAFGLFLDETWRTVFDLAASEPEHTTLRTDGPTFDLYLIPGPSPKGVLERFTDLVGRAPLPPLWALGYHQCRWSYPDDSAVRAIAGEFARREIPLDAVWLDIDHLDGYKVFELSPHRFPDPKTFTGDLLARGVKTVVIVDPAVKIEPGYEVYESGKARDVFVKDRRNEEPLQGEVWPKAAYWPDFIREDVRAWWGALHARYVAAGISGIWCDMNEPSAFDHPGKTLPAGARHGRYWHAEVHNLYGTMMSRATHEGLASLRPDKRPFVLTRSGFSGIQRWAFVWTGDNSSVWEHLEMSVPMLLNLGMSGVPFIGADIGGFSEDAVGELLARWTWLGAFYPFMRNHAGKGSRRQEPWAFGEPWTSRCTEAIRFRYALLPYVYTLAKEASDTGAPPMRPLFFEHPDDPVSWTVGDAFLFGADLLVAPILRPGVDRRLVYLPRGGWQDFWTGERHEGPGWIVARAGDRIPLFQRAGSAIPMTDPAAHTTTARWRPLRFRVFPGPAVRGAVYEDGGDGPIDGATLVLEGDGGELKASDPAREIEIEVLDPTPKRRRL